MLNLILKDILIQKKTLAFIGLYILLFIFAFQSIGADAFAAITIAVTYQLVATASNHEEKAGSDIVLNSLPLSRKEIVVSKYLSVIVYGLMAVLGYMAFSLILSLIPISVNIAPITLESLAVAFAGIMVMNSIYYPIYFRVGYIKARIVTFILFFVFFFGVMSLLGAMSNNESNAMFHAVTSPLNGMSMLQFSLVLIVGALIFMGFSCALSIKLYNGREF